jgi:hypothetical protein
MKILAFGTSKIKEANALGGATRRFKDPALAQKLQQAMCRDVAIGSSPVLSAAAQ